MQQAWRASDEINNDLSDLAERVKRLEVAGPSDGATGADRHVLVLGRQGKDGWSTDFIAERRPFLCSLKPLEADWLGSRYKVKYATAQEADELQRGAKNRTPVGRARSCASRIGSRLASSLGLCRARRQAWSSRETVNRWACKHFGVHSASCVRHHLCVRGRRFRASSGMC